MLDYFDLLKEGVDKACNTDIADIIITDDFINNIAQHTLSKIKK